jgi:hypothetical protein
LRKYLEVFRDLAASHNPEGYEYRSQFDFVLRHGKFYEPRPLPPGMWKGPPKVCYGNAIILGAVAGLRYVEGFAIPNFKSEKLGEIFFPCEHAWNTNEAGELFDPTWNPPGRAYFGVEFSVERADDATWNGDASVLYDYRRRFPIFRTEWTGEDWLKKWPRSRRLEVVRRNYGSGNWRSYPEPPDEMTPKQVAAKIREMLFVLGTEEEPDEAAVEYEFSNATEEEIAEVRRHLTAEENAHIKIRVKR